MSKKVSIKSVNDDFFLRQGLCGSGCPGSHSADQAGAELRAPPAFAPSVPPQSASHATLK